MKNTKMLAILVLRSDPSSAVALLRRAEALLRRVVLVLAMASIAYGSQSLTVNNQPVDSISLEPGESYTVKVVSDDADAYHAYVGFDNGLVLGTFSHLETMMEGGDLAGVTAYDLPAFYGYYVKAGGLSVGPAPGVHFVLEYHAQEVGETDLKLYDEAFASVIDSIHITITQRPAGPSLGIYDCLGLASSEGYPAGDAGGKTLYNLGNVGIGTTSPAAKLHVSGGHMRFDYGHGGIKMTQQSGYSSVVGCSGDNLIIENAAAGGIFFSTARVPNTGAWRLVIANDGNVGIGTTAPIEKLDVAGAANLNKGRSGGALWVNGYEAIWFNDDYFSWGFGGTANFFADSVGIGQADPGPHKLYVNGTGYATGGFWASDLRFKKNIRTIDSPMDKINNIRGVSFEWKRSEYQDKGLPEGEHYGVIAQEIEQILPEIVKEGPNGDKAVSYTELVPILTEAIKEQQKQLEEQQRQVECLLQRVESLERFVQQQRFAAARQVQQREVD